MDRVVWLIGVVVCPPGERYHAWHRAGHEATRRSKMTMAW